MELLVAIGPIILGIALYWVVRCVADWIARRDVKFREERKAALREAIIRRKRQYPKAGKQELQPELRSTTTRSSTPETVSYEPLVKSSIWDTPPPSSAADEPFRGGGGEFSGSGASGSWDSAPSCSSDSSYSSSDSGSSCSSSD